MSVCVTPKIAANISRACGNLSVASQSTLIQSMDTLARMQGLDQLFGNAFGRGGAANFQSFQANFVAPGAIAQPGQLVSLSHTSFSSASGLGLGRMNFADALRFSLATQLAGWGGNPLAFGGAAGCFGGPGAFFGALGNLSGTLQAQLALGQLGFLGRAGAFSAQQTSIGQGQPASFPPAGRSAFLAGLDNYQKNAQRLNVSGSHDVKTINKAIGQLGTAEPTISPAKPGQKTGKGTLVLDQATVSAIRNAPDEASAQAILRKAIEQQTGKPLGTANMNDKGAIRQGQNREAMNQLLGTNVRAGREKNSGSSLVMNEMVSDITKSIRGGSFGTTQVNQAYAQGAVGAGACHAFGYFEGGVTSAEFANGPSALAINLDGYKQAANTVGELYSPLIFDLEGQGLKLQNGGLIEVDLDGDGNFEQVSELDAHIGLLIFDSKFEPRDDEEFHAAGKDMFGNGTDLSAYGIRGPEENGTFANGFDALRALCEHFEIVHGSKQELGADDLAVLEREVGLAMRVGGLADGEDRSFASLGITRIALGDPNKIQDINAAEEDRYGNRLMRQEGACFDVNGTTREYCDIWFNIIARTSVEEKNQATKALSSSQILAMSRRI